MLSFLVNLLHTARDRPLRALPVGDMGPLDRRQMRRTAFMLPPEPDVIIIDDDDDDEGEEHRFGGRLLTSMGFQLLSAVRSVI